MYFHSEHRQLPWCRELWPVPRMEINPETAAELGLEQGDWAWIESPWGKVRQTVDLYYGIAPGTINCEHQWWYPELAQADKGFKLSCINCITDRTAQDKYTGSSTVRGYPVKVYKATPENSPFGNPIPCGNDGTEIIHDSVSYTHLDVYKRQLNPLGVPSRMNVGQLLENHLGWAAKWGWSDAEETDEVVEGPMYVATPRCV